MPEIPVQCKKCGADVLKQTFNRTSGYCVPCKENRRRNWAPKKTFDPKRRSQSLDWMLIRIGKISEDDKTAEYRFTSNLSEPNPKHKYGTIVIGDCSGTLCIDKHTGEIIIVEPMPGDNDKRCSDRAIVKMRKHWESGEYPDQTCYACG